MALREVVPAATFTARVGGGHSDAGRVVVVATVLPLAWPAMVRADATPCLGLQVPARTGDVSRDLAAALEQALAAAPGTAVTLPGLPGPGARLQDLLAPEPPAVTVHDGFDFWLDGHTGEVDPDVRASLERANAAVVPTARVAGAGAAYWCHMRARNHLRWVLPYDEEAALDALARVFVADGLTLGAGSRYVGAFRAHGLLVPVWDLPADLPAEALEEPCAGLAARLAVAVAAPGELGPAERDARQALAARQVTIR